VKALAEVALGELSPVFEEMYSAVGRPSIQPERLLKASLLMALYTVRSERMFCEQLDYNLLFRWFLDMNMDEARFVPTVFTKNRERLPRHNVASQFFGLIVEQARAAGLMSNEHFTVDGTLIEAWASLKSFRRKEEKAGDRPPPDDKGNPSVDFHGEKRSNETHESRTDPESRLARKGNGKEAKLAYSQHALMENRNGLLIELQIAPATGTAERDAAIEMMDDYLPGGDRITLAGDKGYDTRDFVEKCRERNVTPHVAQNAGPRRRSTIDGRTTRHCRLYELPVFPQVAGHDHGREETPREEGRGRREETTGAGHRRLHHTTAPTPITPSGRRTSTPRKIRCICDLVRRTRGGTGIRTATEGVRSSRTAQRTIARARSLLAM
jgi:transposase